MRSVLPTAMAAIMTLTPVALAQGADLDCQSAQSQSGLNVCARDHYAKADAELNEVYALAIRQRPANADSLREAQRAWIESRDKFCDVAVEGMAGTSMRPWMLNTCLTMQTRHRTEELRWLTR